MKKLQKSKFKSFSDKELTKKQMTKVSGGAGTGYDIIIVWAADSSTNNGG